MKRIKNGNMEHVAEQLDGGEWRTLCGRIWEYISEKQISDFGWLGTTVCRSCCPDVGRVWFNVPPDVADILMASNKHRLAAEFLLIGLSWLSDEELDERVSEEMLRHEEWIATNAPF